MTESTVDLQEKYAAEMEAVASAYPDDADIQAVCAEALLCLSPWDLYTRPEGAKPAPNWSSVGKVPNAVGERVVAALDRGLRAAPAHPWLAHLKVHYCEMGPVGAFDWSAADALRAEGSGQVGHLLHMPTHLDIQDGRYDEAISLNVAAYEADLRMHAYAPERFGIYAGYAVHNMEFCAWAAMYAGRRAVALEAVQQIDDFLDEKMLRRGQPTMATFFEARRHPPARASPGDSMPAIHPNRLCQAYTADALMVLVRFGEWDEILATPFRDDQRLYVAHTLFLHFARAVALAARSAHTPSHRHLPHTAELLLLSHVASADRPTQV